MPTKPKKSQKKSTTTRAAAPQPRVPSPPLPLATTFTSRHAAQSPAASRREGSHSSSLVSPPLPLVQSSTSQLSHGTPHIVPSRQNPSTHVAIGSEAQTSGSWTTANALKHELDRYLVQSDALGPDGLPSLYNNPNPNSVSHVVIEFADNSNKSTFASQALVIPYPVPSTSAATSNTDTHDLYMSVPPDTTLLDHAESAGNSAPLSLNAITGVSATSPSGHLSAGPSSADRFPMPFIPSPEQIDEFLRTGIVLQGSNSNASGIPQDSPTASSIQDYPQSQSSPPSAPTPQYLSYS